MKHDYRKVLLEATKFGINRRAAARMRIRYLKPDLKLCLEAWARTGCQVALHWALADLEEITQLMKHCRREEKPKNSNSITDEMIEAAKATPITSVVNFGERGGKAVAFCHEDKRPSMYHVTKTNRAICPVCDKKFNAIDVLMLRDGYSFSDAVRALQ